MVPESLEKNLRINWEVRSSSMCGVFNIYSFLKIYLKVGFGRWM